MPRGLAVLPLLLAPLTACSGGDGACSPVDAAHGVEVVVAADLAPIEVTELRACFDDVCRGGPLRLDDDPEAPGVQRSFIQIEEMGEGEVTVFVHYLKDGVEVQPDPVTVDAVGTFANGRDCPPVGAQVAVTVDRSGLS